MPLPTLDIQHDDGAYTSADAIVLRLLKALIPMDNGYSTASPIGTGVAGLDSVLHGGFTPERIYLLQGVPGSGKTTMPCSS